MVLVQVLVSSANFLLFPEETMQRQSTLCVLTLALVSTLCRSQPSVAEANTTTAAITEFSLDLEHKSSSTSSISISWITRIPEWITVQKYQILTQRIGSQSMILSPYLKSDAVEQGFPNWGA